jgi:hypothetical protein
VGVGRYRLLACIRFSDRAIQLVIVDGMTEIRPTIAPQARPPLIGRVPVRLTHTDRIIRLGLIGALFYYAGRPGWQEPGGTMLAVIGIHCAIMGCLARGPIYRLRANGRSEL